MPVAVPAEESYALRKAVTDRSKGSSVFQIQTESDFRPSVKVNIRNSIAKAPAQPINAEMQGISDQVKRDRDSITNRGKNSSVFSAASEQILFRPSRAVNIRNEVEKAPSMPVNSAHKAVSDQVARDRAAARARGRGSNVFANGGGAYAEESESSGRRQAGVVMASGNAENVADAQANHARRQAMLAGSGALW